MQSHRLHTAKQLDRSHYTQSGCYSRNDFNSSAVAQAAKGGKKKKMNSKSLRKNKKTKKKTRSEIPEWKTNVKSRVNQVSRGRCGPSQTDVDADLVKW